MIIAKEFIKKAVLPSVLMAFVSLFMLLISNQEVSAGIATTKHNLAYWATSNTTRSVDESRICIFCHIPHAADTDQVVPLWSHENTSATYTAYSTKYAGPSQPTGISKKCLSCHDGTVSVGALLNFTIIDMVGNVDALGRLTGSANLGTDMTTLITPFGSYSESHPHAISFNYSTVATNYNNNEPGTEFQVPISAFNKSTMLDGDGKMQCHSCHDPHDDKADSVLGARAATNDPLWRKAVDCTGDNASVCGACHLPARDTGVPCPDSNYDN